MTGAWVCDYCGGTNDGGTTCPRCGGSRAIEGPGGSKPGEHAWTDPETGYLCSIKQTPEGCWCGYVMIPWNHPVVKVDWEDHPPVHGGITWKENHFPGGKPLNGSYVVGFDCAHGWDVVPGSSFHMPDATWKDAKYAASECRKLAAGLKVMVPEN
jgi:hypothetical protein